MSFENSSTIGGAADEAAAPRLCELCGIEISAARLEAMPYTNRCLVCTELSGDVTPTRRFDEPGLDGEVVSTYYRRPNQYLEVMVSRNLGQDLVSLVGAREEE